MKVLQIQTIVKMTWCGVKWSEKGWRAVKQNIEPTNQSIKITFPYVYWKKLIIGYDFVSCMIY